MLFNSNPAMAKLLWRQHRTRLLATLITSVAYAFAAATLLPTKHHIDWLVLRTAFLACLLHLDAVSLNFKLRFTKKRFVRMLGGHERGGWLNLFFVGSIGVFLLLDFFRHVLIINASPIRDVVDVGLVNPITGNTLKWTNHQLAEACYFTSMIFLMQIGASLVKTHFGHSTVLLSTNFEMLDARNAAVDTRMILSSPSAGRR